MRLVFVTHSIPDTMADSSGPEGGAYVAQHLDVAADGGGAKDQPHDVVECSAALILYGGDPNLAAARPDADATRLEAGRLHELRPALGAFGDLGAEAVHHAALVVLQRQVLGIEHQHQLVLAAERLPLLDHHRGKDIVGIDADHIGVAQQIERYAFRLGKALFPRGDEYGGEFARVITHAATYAQSLIDAFSQPEKLAAYQRVILISQGTTTASFIFSGP